jgi:hypothetical protein
MKTIPAKKTGKQSIVVAKRALSQIEGRKSLCRGMK